MKYHSLYRKWRPQIFEDIIGQNHITQTLINAISLNRISHAYVFSGPRGVGKTTTARILAKSLNCEKGPTIYPCNKCNNCIKITEGYSMDVVEIDGASNNGVENIRELRNKVNFAPTEGKYKIYIIDEVHMLSSGAFNALLKTLEEPPPHVIFVFATTAPHKIPDTILSRCQWFNFRRIPLQKIVDKLQLISKDENLIVEENALNIIARNATGSMRDAESIFEQVIAYCGKEINVKNVIDIMGITDDDIFFNILDAVIQNDTLRAIEVIHQSSDSGGDPAQFIRNFTEYVHNLSLLKICNMHILNAKGIFIEESEKMLNQSKSIDMEILFNMVNYLTEIEKKMKYSYHPWLLLEMYVLKFTFVDKKKEIKKDENNLEPDLKMLKKEENKELLIGKDIKNKEEKKTKKNNSKVSIDSDLKNAWPTILTRIKKTRISLYSFITVNNSLTIKNDKIIIGFDKEYTFHKEILEKKSNKSLLQDLIKEEIGVPFIIECVINKNRADCTKEEFNNENKTILNGNDKIEEVLVKSKKEISQINNKSNNDDSILQESLNLFMGKIIDE
ncbi:MAG: DNA polymerase III subunit gamma/tau [Candidatus Atribacteria bacterium]|nr:DNA polymerase III subunit gamma/tau [Candidatus Atribacteria bacterium]